MMHQLVLSPLLQLFCLLNFLISYCCTNYTQRNFRGWMFSDLLIGFHFFLSKVLMLLPGLLWRESSKKLRNSASPLIEDVFSFLKVFLNKYYRRCNLLWTPVFATPGRGKIFFLWVSFYVAYSVAFLFLLGFPFLGEGGNIAANWTADHVIRCLF